jgi:hydrogenase nickel incorporation protein HypA/HybF
MHELGIAIEIIELARKEAARAGGARVEAVHVSVGEWSGVVKEALLFAWEAASMDTELAGARLEVEDTAGQELEVTALEVEDDAPAG